MSTRGRAPVLGFGDVLLAGLADDGGLYVPESWPALGRDELEHLAGLPYAAAATEIMWPFVEGDVDHDDFARMVAEAYAAFDTVDVAPLRPLGDELWVQELFHGPTYAFKDVALQLVGRLFDHELARRGERVTIVGATSGDTGSAAIEACRDRAAIDVFILHPSGRVSEVQRRQMTTVLSPNVHNLAVRGTFDDCQDLVKAMFADVDFRERYHLSAVNSINWARVMAQIVYYVTASLALGGLDRPVGFAVPTGNFGNVFAGWAARRMGAPVGQLVIGTNRNDVLTRFFTTGTMTIEEVVPTTSPSMDIQVSSNLERLLFEVLERDGDAVRDLLSRFRADGTVSVGTDVLERLRTEIDVARVDEADVLAVIADVWARGEMLVDPHTAVGIGAARAARRDRTAPMVCLATAHPAKFPDAVERATGEKVTLPTPLAELFDRPERVTEIDDDLAAVEAHIRGVLG